MSNENIELVKETYRLLGVRHWKGFSLMMLLLKKRGQTEFLRIRQEVLGRLFYLKNPIIYFFAVLLRSPDKEKRARYVQMRGKLLAKTNWLSNEERTEINEEIARQERKI
jgi:hypothetical protein